MQNAARDEMDAVIVGGVESFEGGLERGIHEGNPSAVAYRNFLFGCELFNGVSQIKISIIMPVLIFFRFFKNVAYHFGKNTDVGKVLSDLFKDPLQRIEEGMGALVQAKLKSAQSQLMSIFGRLKVLVDVETQELRRTEEEILLENSLDCVNDAIEAFHVVKDTKDKIMAKKIAINALIAGSVRRDPAAVRASLEEQVALLALMFVKILPRPLPPRADPRAHAPVPLLSLFFSFSFHVTLPHLTIKVKELLELDEVRSDATAELSGGGLLSIRPMRVDRIIQVLFVILHFEVYAARHNLETIVVGRTTYPVRELLESGLLDDTDLSEPEKSVFRAVCMSDQEVVGHTENYTEKVFFFCPFQIFRVPSPFFFQTPPPTQIQITAL